MRSQITGMQRADLGPQLRQVAVIDDHIVGGLQARRAGGLRSQHGPRLRQRHAVARLHPPELQLLVAVDQQHPVDAAA